MSTCIKRYDTYTPSCVSAPVTENWTAPLAYAMKAILQRNEPHAVFGMPLSAAVGIYVEKINPLTVTDDNTTFETVQGDASLQVEAFAFVEPFTVAPIRLRPVMTASFLDSLLAIDPSVTLTDDGINKCSPTFPDVFAKTPGDFQPIQSVKRILKHKRQAPVVCLCQGSLPSLERHA